MILEFAVQNYRSIKERQVFSLVAEAGKSKSQNVFEVMLPGNQSVRLLKSAVIYGANASGKSNLIKAFQDFIQFVLNSDKYQAEGPMPAYDPFLFSPGYESQPAFFSLIFIHKGIKYKYEVEFNWVEILSEMLDYYPKGQIHNLLKRPVKKSESGLVHTFSLSKSQGNKEYDVFKNQLALSKFGREIPNEILSNIYVYFKSLDAVDALNLKEKRTLEIDISNEFAKSENAHLLQRLSRLVRIADTKLARIGMEEIEAIDLGKKNGHSRRFVPYGKHQIYENRKQVGEKELSFWQQSAGTNALFTLGGLMLKKLETGAVLFYDELESSLHPKLAKLLVQLFHSPVANPKNAQLVFSTHEVTLLDRELFRTDQIWFTEKNEYGETELYSAQDFEGVREDVPFDKWYMAGKFGGIPKIEDINAIFSNE